jgi:hypothetical protein
MLQLANGLAPETSVGAAPLVVLAASMTANGIPASY